MNPMKMDRKRFREAVAGQRKACEWMVDDCHASLTLLFLYWSRISGIANAVGGSHCFRSSDIHRVIVKVSLIIQADFEEVAFSGIWKEYSLTLPGLFDKEVTVADSEKMMDLLGTLIRSIGYPMHY